ncbi:hypothetical protein BJ912DRAFT_1053674 [Pholiota molesta]|nr:hypothetical protein BJ912DRAFT_1053674 [Pholiota molesta]
MIHRSTTLTRLNTLPPHTSPTSRSFHTATSSPIDELTLAFTAPSPAELVILDFSKNVGGSDKNNDAASASASASASALPPILLAIATYAPSTSLRYTTPYPSAAPSGTFGTTISNSRPAFSNFPLQELIVIFLVIFITSTRPESQTFLDRSDERNWRFVGGLWRLLEAHTTDRRPALGASHRRFPIASVCNKQHMTGGALWYYSRCILASPCTISARKNLASVNCTYDPHPRSSALWIRVRRAARPEIAHLITSVWTRSSLGNSERFPAPDPEWHALPPPHPPMPGTGSAMERSSDSMVHRR